MICPNCKKQIPDDSDECVYCATQIDHKKQVSNEISFRRYQRWFFYGLIIVFFVSMLGVLVKIYNTNSSLLAKLATTEGVVETKTEELDQTKGTLTEKEKILQQTKANLEQKQADLKKAQENLSAKDQELAKKAQELKDELDKQTEIKADYQNCQLDLNKADSNIYSLIINLGEGVSNEKNDSVKALIKELIRVAKKTKTKVGICGQAPSDFPDFNEFLVECGIDSISLIPDTVIKTTQIVNKAEAKLNKKK